MDAEAAGRKSPGGTGDTHQQGNYPQGAKKNELQPHRNAYWCIPPKENAEFVACMEDILDIYEMPYDPAVPVVCMDEKPYQLLDEAREPLPMRPGDTQKTDSEYVRNGTCSIFVFVEPLGGIRHVSVREHRTAVDWAEEIKYLVDTSYPDKQKIILVMDNLNTHAIASLYKAFPAQQARRIARKLEIHYTPKHGSCHGRDGAQCHDSAMPFPEDRRHRQTPSETGGMGNGPQPRRCYPLLALYP